MINLRTKFKAIGRKVSGYSQGQLVKAYSRPAYAFLGPVIFRFIKSNFRFDSVSLLATLNSMKSQYIERKCSERSQNGTISVVNRRKRAQLAR